MSGSRVLAKAVLQRRVVSGILICLLVLISAYVFGVFQGWYGGPEQAGIMTPTAIPETVTELRAEHQIAARPEGVKQQILFGDLHVHTTYSSDAFRMSLPFVQGEGAHPPADACDYARYCSSLDFWSITDHAEGLTPYLWQKTKEAVRQCNQVATDQSNPDVVAFLGWEWTQSEARPEAHYGHKNILFLDTAEELVPSRPIASASNKAFTELPLKFRIEPPFYDPGNRQRYFDYDYSVRQVSREKLCQIDKMGADLPADCKEYAEDPGELFARIGAWKQEYMVIPHGNSWGVYTPATSSWDKQLKSSMNNPAVQFLMEIYSGHGSAEQYRDWRAVTINADGSKSCPQPQADYLPSCWRAGEIIAQRCSEAGESASECEQRAALARQLYLDKGQLGWLTVPGARLEDWLDSGQCRDCYLPAFNMRPGGSAQYAQAITNFDDRQAPKRFRFGFIASSDNHSARPGTGYKETDRGYSTDWWGYKSEAAQQRFATDTGELRAEAALPDMSKVDPFGALELERQASFFTTGGLVAVHAEGRDRNSIWNSLKRKQVYGTTGERILLWFNLLNPVQDSVEIMPMGSELELSHTPRFKVTAVGARRQNPGCPEHSINALGEARLDKLCRGECYFPSDQRKLITRIEVVRIQPQMAPGEPVEPLIQDAWKVFDCAPQQEGCSVEFEDPDYISSARDTVYYVRAIQESKEKINGANLRCENDESGQCIAVNPCYGDFRTNEQDACLSEVESIAWSSPIFVDFPTNR